MLNLEMWVDCSSFQNDYDGNDPVHKPGKPINFAKMQDQGVAGVAIRKCLGKVHDPWFLRNWQGAEDAGLKRTVYCVPYVAFDMGPQQRVMATWPGGGMFDGSCDIPAWDDVERKHQLPLKTAMERLLPYHFAMLDTFDAVEFYTGKGPWEGWYSKAAGWGEDWGLVVANYLPSLYHLPILALLGRVADGLLHPAVPRGWLYDKAGNLVPSEKRWNQWQISADGNNLGPAFGAHSRSIDISFRQVPAAPPPPPPSSALADKVRQLRLAFGRADDALHEVEQEVGVVWPG